MLFTNFLGALITALASVSLSQQIPTHDHPASATFYVPTLPDLHQDETHPLRMWAGHISSDPYAYKAKPGDVTAHLYFVMVKNRRIADKERVMFWFNGGPGCSSFDGLMMELGPWRMDKQGGLRTQNGGWEEYTTMIFVDQPAGTGFSYPGTNKHVGGIHEASDQFLEFLRNFYKVFPELQSMDTYLGGESYAGQYVPYFSLALLESDIKVPFKGATIGNGWIDLRSQNPSYLDYAVKHGHLDEKSADYAAAKQATDECVKQMNLITGYEPVHIDECEDLMDAVLQNRRKKVGGQEMCANVYDIRYDDTYPDCGMNWPPEIHNITTYLDKKDVVQALHATDKPEAWIECGGVKPYYVEENVNSSITVLPRILEKIQVLIFAGDQDFICNYMGLEAMIAAMTWNGEKGFGSIKTQQWSVNNQPAGTWAYNRNLTYTKLFNASHMAPFDVPDAAHDMILRWMGMNFSAITEGSARIPSSLGTQVKPLFSIETDHPIKGGEKVPPKSPEQDKVMWEAYYNAGSAALVLVVIFVFVGTFLWCRLRRPKSRNKSGSDYEESVPLTTRSRVGVNDGFEDDPVRGGKGKRVVGVAEDDRVFAVGEDEEA